MGRTPRSSKPRARRASDTPPAARARTPERQSGATPAALRGATADRWFGDLLESAPDAIVGVDDQGRIVLVNAQTEKIFGYGRDELLNQPVEILLPERVRRAHQRHRAGYVLDPRTRPMGVGLDLAGRRKDGSEFPAEISLSPFQTQDGVIVTSIIRDISDRRKVEGKFRGLLEAAPDAMIIVERTGRIVLVNSQAERLFGYRRDQLLGQPVEMLVPERFRGHYLEHRVAYFEGPRVRAMGSGLELYGLRRDGSEFPVEISLSPLETEEGILVTSAIRDVSERQALVREREARAEAEKVAGESARLYEAAQEARANAEAANCAKDEFLSVLSHELRTPLTPILAWTRQLIRGKVAPAGVPRALESIERNVKAQARLVEDLLDVSRIVSGKLHVDQRPVELPDVIQAAVDSVRPAADAKQLALELLVDPGAGMVLGDPLRLQQVVSNLLSNAVKFTPAGGRIELRLASRGPHVELTVTDTGQGIAPEFMPDLFQRFRQADSSARRVHGGLGIGLAIVRTLVELHGGSVQAASRGRGQGATFTVRLPVFEGQPDLGAGQRPRDALAERAHLHGLHVLIVEDDLDTGSLLAEVVASSGAEARTAGSAAEALDVLGRWRVDLLLSDIGMPGEDGYSLIRKVRQRESAQGAKAVPAIAITAYARAEDRQTALAAGFDMHVAKPLDPEELLATVAEVAGRGIPPA